MELSGGEKRRVAIIGAGISGISCAFRLQKNCDVTIFEKNPYVGGHTNTILVNEPDSSGEPIAVDTGFIVLNDKNYPRLQSFFRELQVPLRMSDMSFGFSCEESGLCYAGTSFSGLFASSGNAFSPKFWRMLQGILKFSREGKRALGNGSLKQGTIGEFVQKIALPENTIRDFVLPMGAAIWSAPAADILKFPAETFLNFFSNHGLLSLKDRPRWQTVIGGSHVYVKKFLENFSGKIHARSPVVEVSRAPEQGKEPIRIRLASGEEHGFDLVVFASHADETLSLLREPSEDERRLLGAWEYQKNSTVLHTDESVLPKNRRAWASWNYTRERAHKSEQPVSVTYDMNRLQGLSSKKRYLVSLNRVSEIPKERIVAEFEYFHPQFTTASISSQRELHILQGKQGSYFCGSYFGNGFHEDGIRSGEAAAALVLLEVT